MEMFPGHRGMNSYPYQRNPMPSTQYYHPTWDGAAPQAKEDLTGPSFMYEPWLHNYGYPVPTPCHSCCNHAQYPAYHNFRPPYPHFPSPPPHNHCYGSYPAYPQPYPFSYIPPPHYSMELPRYEYDKSVPHCCGCPNHQCHMKEDKNIKIEEHEPDVEPKKPDSLVPAGTNKFPYPVLWIPPEYTMKKEQPQRAVDNESDKEQIFPYVKKPQWQQRPNETEAEKHQDPNVNHGWFPLDIDSIRKLIEGGDGRKTSCQDNKDGNGKKASDAQSKDENKQFPYPIFWIPYDGQDKDRLSNQEERNAGRPPTKELAGTMKSESPDNEPEKLKTGGVGTQAIEKPTNVKTIPVRQLDESVPELSKKDEEHKGEGTRASSNQENARNGSNGHSSCPTKKSKLPPICLRVDPPKKKNGSSRSPSPPGDKKRRESDDSKAESKSRKEINVTEAVEKTPSGTKTEVSHGAGEEKQGTKVVQVKDADDGGKSGDAKSGEDKGLQAQELEGAKESKPQQASKQERKILSDSEAAAKIQSAYRGYDVRRWEPLKKLRQIAKIREEATEVKKHIEAYESCAGSCINDREKVAVGETIMNLLLKLDTIQGLHPSLRDVRRSVAKDLITLQERLDSIASQKFIPTAQETAPIETMAETPNVSISSAEGSKNETAKEPSMISTQDEGSLGGDTNLTATEEDEAPPNLNEVPSSQPPASKDVVCGSENMEISETFPGNKESTNQSEDEAAISSAGSFSELKADPDGSEGKLPTESHEPLVLEADMASGMENEEANLLAELPREAVEDNEKEFLEEEEDRGTTSLREKPVEGAGLTPGCEAVDVDSGSTEKDKELNVLPEMPEKVTEEDAKEPTSLSVETLNINGEMEPSCEKPDLKCGLLTIEPEVCKPDEVTTKPEVCQPDEVTIEPEVCKPDEVSSKAPYELSSGAEETLIEDQEVEPSTEKPLIKDQEMETSTEKPVLVCEDLSAIEPVSCKPDEPIGEETAHSEGGLLVGEVSEVSANENDTKQSPQMNDTKQSPQMSDTKQSPQMSNAELTSTTAYLENPVSNNEEAQAEKDFSEDQETVPGYENTNCQVVGSLTVEHEEEQQHEEEYEVPQQSAEEQGSVAGCKIEEEVDKKIEEEVDKKIIEENEKLRAMLEKLIASGREQQDVISSLSGKVKDLEKKLAKNKKKKKSTRRPRVIVSHPPCGKLSDDSLKGRPMGVAS